MSTAVIDEKIKARATSRALEHGSRNLFADVIYVHVALSGAKTFGYVSGFSRDRKSIVIDRKRQPTSVES